MKKILIAFSIIVVFAVAVLGGSASIALAASRAEGAIPESGDLCGGTGGNGQIVDIGTNEFTMKRNDNGNNQIVHVSKRVSIKTSAGSASLSDLKPGERVTLVGGPNRDGSFTADTVVVCNGAQAAEVQQGGMGRDRQNPVAVRNPNAQAYEKVSHAVNAVTILLVVLIWIGIVIVLALKKRKNAVYVLFFTIFYIYLYKVLDYTLIQFQSLLLIQYFVPDLMLNGFKDGTSINLIPLATLTLEDVKTSLLNILMMMPFGFGLPFITDFRMKKVVLTGLFFSIGIELLQFITGFTANTTFRVADINDVIFNTAGVAIGYLLFIVFVRLYRRVSRNWKVSANPILSYIADRPRIDK